MNFWTSTSVRFLRFFIISIALVAYIVLLVITVNHAITIGIMTFNSWLLFGFSALTSLLFFSMGSLVWVYARDRTVAKLLFCFCLAMAMTFAVEIASNDQVFSALATSGSNIALILLSFFLFTFPKNYINTRSSELSKDGISSSSSIFARVYLTVLTLIGFVLTVDAMLDIWWHNNPLLFIDSIRFPYFAIGLFCALAIVAYSYLFNLSSREKQQMRLFIGGIVIAIVPLLILTILPTIFGIPSLDGRWGSASLCLLPPLIGYSILRYQILILDTYARRFVACIVGIAFISALIYIIVTICSVGFQPQKGSTADALLFLFAVLAITAALSPIIWWFAQRLTDYLFFSEILRFRRLAEKTTFMSDEPLEMDNAAGLLVSAIRNAFNTPRVGIFMLDESMGLYRLTPERTDDLNEAARDQLLQSLCKVLRIEQMEESEFPRYIGRDLPIVKKLMGARRPLLLSEATRTEEDKLLGLDRFFVGEVVPDYEDCLLAPILAQGETIGLLILGERGDQQPYAGPDFEIVQILIARFAPFLNSACLYENAHRHTVLLNNFYSLTVMPSYIFKTADDIAHIYTTAAAKAAQAEAEIWWYEEKDQELLFAHRAGDTSFLSSYTSLQTTENEKWVARFFQGDHEKVDLPSWIPVTPKNPFAWLPLQKNKKLFGVLLLNYTRPHVFSREEKRVLEMFANQCVATLENVFMNEMLIKAKERLEEVDKLKDQFIVTASHELRTPLTAVMGYIELLSQYYTTLPPERIDEFIERAQRGCDELSLLVENIMDASRVSVGEEQPIRLRPVALKNEVMHVLEILGSTCAREQRKITVDVLETTLVAADSMRLRQILLNLLNNALKYSPKGTNIEISAQEQQQQVIVHVRDHGYGIPLVEQGHLFERFTRLDRDINSPTRGAGLGLFICKQLLEAMHGYIWVESPDSADQGSTFSFALALVSERQQEQIGKIQLPA